MIDLLDMVRPFCDIVINEETTGPVTGQAIFALDTFLSSGLFGKSIWCVCVEDAPVLIMY